MAIVSFSGSFNLLRDTEQSSPFFNVDFSSNLVTVSASGFTSTSNQYAGVFQQADDGTISGVVTGITGLFTNDAFFADRPSPPLLFSVGGLRVDIANFETEILSAASAEALQAFFLAGDDLIFVNTQRSDGVNANNRITIDLGMTQVHGYAGNDLLIGSAQTDDWLFGDGGNDSLFGSFGNDILVGGDGDDLLTDHRGADRFEGGAGNDTIIAGYATRDGADTAVYSGTLEQAGQPQTELRRHSLTTVAVL